MKEMPAVGEIQVHLRDLAGIGVELNFCAGGSGCLSGPAQCRE
jgi:hypothetical protein